MADVLAPARTWLAEQIRSRVIGDEPDVKAAAIMDAPGPRWFADDRPIRRVHADASMFVGGLRALLLQSLHPLAMAGVAQHSDYRHDPWGRLQRTADFLAATTYAPIPVAEHAIAVVRTVHERVVGTASDGRRYSANDPHLLRWVHVCEVDSFLAAHQRFGSEPLSPAEADAYVADTALVARQLGVNEPPTTVRDLRAELREYRPELRGTKEARDAARFLLLEPPLPLAARPAYTVLGAAAVALLPGWARWPLRLPFLPVSEAVLVRPAGAAITQLIRWSLTPTAA
ncbi:MAG: oxygenase MpaB family protein [Acidimicrobiales bacterium]